jgi:hypothetical protein
MGELVYQSQGRVAIDDRVGIHLFDGHAFVDDLLARHDVQAGGKLGSSGAAVGLNEANHDLGAALSTAVKLFEGGIGLADARRYTQVHAVASARAAAGLLADAVQHLFGTGTAIRGRGADTLGPQVNHGRA